MNMIETHSVPTSMKQCIPDPYLLRELLIFSCFMLNNALMVLVCGFCGLKVCHLFFTCFK
jgi:hypothetical protein